MVANIVKVYGEDLLSFDFETTPNGAITSPAINVGETQGALCLYVLSREEYNLMTSMEVTVTHSDKETGTFSALTSFVLPNGTAYLESELVKVVALPAETKTYIKVSTVNSQENGGGMRVCLGYLPR